jgi:hypothetical protein
MNRNFRQNGGFIPRSQLSEGDLEYLAKQHGADADNTPKSAVARMMMNLSSNIDDMRTKNQGSPDDLSDDLQQYASTAKNIAYRFELEEKRKRDAARLARIHAFAANQQIKQIESAKSTLTAASSHQLAPQPTTLTEFGPVSNAITQPSGQESIEEIKHYFDSKFAEVNTNLKAISNLLYQVLSSNAWQEEWQLSDINDEEFTDTTDTDEALQAISEGNQQD